MGLLLGLLLISFFANSIFYIPFINLLYRLKFQRQKQKTKDVFKRPTPIFDRFHRKKVGTPVGGGLLIIVSVTIFFSVAIMILPYFWVKITSIYGSLLYEEIRVLLFTFLSFALLGIYDDIRKTFVFPGDDFFGMRLRHKLFFEIVLSLVIAFWLYAKLKISILHIPFLGVIDLGILYVPFAALVILSFTNAFNISDGLDGLAAGLLMIALISFWVISSNILDTPLSLFIALWLGALIAFLYFNIYPARIFLGDVGALSFGATLGVIGLLLGKIFPLLLIGGLFVGEAASSLVQLIHKRIYGKKIFAAAPLHLWLQYKSWNEPKIVMRFWLIGAVLALIGLWIALTL